MIKIGIIESKDFSRKALRELKKIGSLEIYNSHSGTLKQFIENKNVIFVRLAHKYGKTLLDGCNDLQVICSPTTGLNHIDLEYTNKRKIKVLSLKNERVFLKTVKSTSEHTLGLTLSLLRQYKRIIKCDYTKEPNRESYKGLDLDSCRVGIIGLGRIGTHLTEYFHAFGSRSHFYDIDSGKRTKLASKHSSIEDLVQASDVIILSASYSPDNHEIIGSNIIDKMYGKYFINISRGELVSEDYLLKKIKEGHFSGVALDVIQNEQEEKNNLNRIVELTKGDLNFIYTPHVGGATFSSMKKTEEFVTGKLIDLVKT